MTTCPANPDACRPTSTMGCCVPSVQAARCRLSVRSCIVIDVMFGCHFVFLVVVEHSSAYSVYPLELIEKVLDSCVKQWLEPGTCSDLSSVSNCVQLESPNQHSSRELAEPVQSPKKLIAYRSVPGRVHIGEHPLLTAHHKHHRAEVGRSGLLSECLDLLDA